MNQMKNKLSYKILIFFCLFSILPKAVLAETKSEQGDVVIGARVLPNAIFLPPSRPEVVLESVPPDVQKSLLINQDAVYTNSLKVKLAILVQDAFQMAISNTRDFTGISWESYQTDKDWQLKPGDDGNRIVYAKFRSSGGGVSDVVSDSIILDTTAPINVSDFQAVIKDGQIELTWQNPVDQDFAGVRILRSEDFYPADQNAEAVVVFDQKGNSLIDTGFDPGVFYYYSAFAYDYADNYASGAVVFIAASVSGEVTTEEPFEPELEEIMPTEEISEEELLDIRNLNLLDFEFWQKGKKISIEDNTIIVKAGLALTVSIDYEKLPRVLKTILVSLKDQQNRFFSFLLKVNADKSKYQAVFLTPKEQESYKFKVSLLDYKNKLRQWLPGTMIVQGAFITDFDDSNNHGQALLIGQRTIRWPMILLILFIFIITGMFLLLLKKIFVLVRKLNLLKLK